MRGTLALALFANAVLAVPGISLIVYGLLLKYEDDVFNSVFARGKPWDPDNILLGAGGLFIASAISRCMAVYKRDKRILMGAIFTTLSHCLLGLVLVIMVFAFYYQPKPYAVKAVQEAIQDDYGRPNDKNMNSREEGYDDSPIRLSKAIDNIQKKFECCGVAGYVDWEGSMWSSMTGLKVPASCCNTTDYTACQNGTGHQGIYAKGCSEELEDWATKAIPLIGGVGCATLIFSIMGGILTKFTFQMIDTESVLSDMLHRVSVE